MGGLSLCFAGLHSLSPKLQRDELQLRAGTSPRRLASLIHRTAVSDSQVRVFLSLWSNPFVFSHVFSLCSQIPVGGPEAHRADGVPAPVRVPPRGAVPAALPARADSMHAGGTLRGLQ